MDKRLDARLGRLEQSRTSAERPPYLVVADESEITPAMLASRLKIYVGISPDDWSDEHEHPPAEVGRRPPAV